MHEESTQVTEVLVLFRHQTW